MGGGGGGGSASELNYSNPPNPILFNKIKVGSLVPGAEYINLSKVTL